MTIEELIENVGHGGLQGHLCIWEIMDTLGKRTKKNLWEGFAAALDADKCGDWYTDYEVVYMYPTIWGTTAALVIEIQER